MSKALYVVVWVVVITVCSIVGVHLHTLWEPRNELVKLEDATEFVVNQLQDDPATMMVMIGTGRFSVNGVTVVDASHTDGLPVGPYLTIAEVGTSYLLEGHDATNKLRLHHLVTR